MKIVLLLLRLLLGGVLFYAGFTKMRAGWEFAETIANFRLLPAQGNQILAVVLPWVELTAGALLVFGVWVRASALIGAALFTAFGIAVSIALAKGLDIDCGCFGTDSGASLGLQTLAIDIGGMIVSALLLWKVRETGDPNPQSAIRNPQ